jgi:hypothetical protein
MDKRGRYKKSAIRSTDVALHPKGKSAELIKDSSEKKKVTIKEEDEEQEEDKSPRFQKRVNFEESDEGDNRLQAPTEVRKKGENKSESDFRGSSQKHIPQTKISTEKLAKSRKDKLLEIK